MNQVKKDIIIGVHSKHQLTCPFINALQFISNKSTKAYTVELSESPKNLYINTSELLESMYDLDKWTKEIIEVYKKLPTEIKSDIENNPDKKDRFNLIDELMSIRTEDKIKEYEQRINSTIKKWEDDNIEYSESLQAIENYKIQMLENSILISTTDSEIIKQEYREKNKEYNININNLNQYIDDLNEDFETLTREDFDRYTFEFSHYLEMVRRRNNELRETISDLRDEIMTKAKHVMGYYQPIEFLNTKYSAFDKLSDKKIINLGIMNNESDYNTIADFNKDGKWYFSKMINFLYSKNALTTSQKFDLINNLEKDPNMKEMSTKKEKLFESLSENGFEITRYYESVKDFIDNRNNPQIENIQKIENKTKPKSKIRP